MNQIDFVINIEYFDSRKSIDKKRSNLYKCKTSRCRRWPQFLEMKGPRWVLSDRINSTQTKSKWFLINIWAWFVFLAENRMNPCFFFRKLHFQILSLHKKKLNIHELQCIDVDLMISSILSKSELNNDQSSKHNFHSIMSVVFALCIWWSSMIIWAILLNSWLER